MQLSAIVLAMLAAAATGALADVTGSWVRTKAECRYRSGERDEFGISGRAITNLEFHCDIRSKTRKNGYTVARAVCGGEGSQSTQTIRYKVDAEGALHIKIGSQPEEVYRYSCP